jgi:hypothetical protein
MSDLGDTETDEINIIWYWDYTPVGDYTHWLGIETYYNYDSSIDLSEDETYYCTLERNGAAVSLKIYSNSARTNLLDTISSTVGTTTKHRYLYGPRCGNWGGDSKTSFWIENLNIVSNS